MNANERKTVLIQNFEAWFGSSPTLLAQAPGRVDLMGSHTDYNLGYVLTEAIDRNVWMTVRPRKNRRLCIRSLDVDGVGEFDLDSITYNDDVPWSNYIGGVAAVFDQQGYPLRGFDGLIHSTVPIGSGLSSSAALEVSTAVVLNALGDLEMSPVRMAKLCQRAENEFVGMNCGILDQYTSAMGEAGRVLLLDCRDITSETRPIAKGIHVVICDTRAKRELTGSEYADRRAQCERGVRILRERFSQIQSLRDANLNQLAACQAEMSPLVAKRCRFIIEENQRVLDIATAFEQGDFDQISQLSQASFEGARDLYEISCTEMERMMDAMLGAPGVIGARQAGAGFGGCMVAFVRDGHDAAFSEHVREQYAASTGIQAEIYPVQAAPGAGWLDFPVNPAG